MAGDKIANNPEQNYTVYTVTNLKLNTRYKFEVQPYLEGKHTAGINIGRSDSVGWTKTHCDGKSLWDSLLFDTTQWNV